MSKTSYFEFLKKINEKTSSKRIMDALPDLYEQVPMYVHEAITNEVATYNLAGEKKEYITEKVKGSIIASFHFDEDLISKLSVLTSDADKIYLLRKYLREYVRREINLESANAVREARDKIITEEGKSSRNIFRVLDPRWKKKVKDGDFTQYKKYRDDVIGLAFPDASVANKSTESENFRRLKELAQEYNDGKLSLTSGATGAVVNPEVALNNIANSRLNNASRGTRVYNSAYQGFLTLEQQAILNNIESKVNTYVKDGLSAAQKVELMKAIESGSVASATKFLKLNVFKQTSEDGKNATEITTSLGETKPQIKIGSDGKARVSGNDVARKNFEAQLGVFEKRVAKDSTNAVIDVQQAYINANTTALRTVIQSQGKAVDSALLDQVKKNELANNILNLSKALKDAKSLSGGSASEVAAIKKSVLSSINLMNFSSASERERFIRAVNNNDYRYLKRFTTPGLVGNGTFGKFMEDLNESQLQIAGKYDSQELATNALNFNNQISIHRKTILDSYIYAAQMGFDQGYLVSEIKQSIKKSRFGQIWTQVDTVFSWDSFKKGARDSFVKGALKFGNLIGKSASSDDINFVLDVFGGKKNFKDLTERQLKSLFNKFLAKTGSKIQANFELTWKNFLKSSLFQSAKLKTLKNLRFLEKAFSIGFKKNFGILSKGSSTLFKKVAAPIPAIMGKYLSRGWGSFAGFTGKLFTIGSSFIPSSLSIGSTAAFIRKYQTYLAIGLGVMLLVYILYVLFPIMPIISTNNSSSSSSTQYMPEAYEDVVLSSFDTFTQKLDISKIVTSGNQCLDGDPKADNSVYIGSDWNNLNLKDFDGLDDVNNCQIMCNARKLMAGMAWTKTEGGGSIRCNINYLEVVPNASEFPKQGGTEKTNYVCSDLIINSYFTDDPEMTARGGRLVGSIDNYLKENSSKDPADTTKKYVRVDLATPNDPSPKAEDMLSIYQPICHDLSVFKPGNIFIIRGNTCNDQEFNADPELGVSYKTKDPLGRIVDNWGAHIEMVLKIETAKDGSKVLKNINTNNVRKVTFWPLLECGGGKYKLKEKDLGTSLRGSLLNKDYTVNSSVSFLYGKKIGVGVPNVQGFPCRVYQIKREVISGGSGLTCPSVCQIPPSNYPDRDTY